LPDRVLSEELVGSRERRVMEDIRISFEHVTKCGTQLGQPGLFLLLLFCFQ
jgi:hypothetical protein